MRKFTVCISRVMAGIALAALVFMVSPSTRYEAQANYPGAALFTFQCGNSGITFYLHGTAVLQASFSQMSGPLSTAMAAQQNQPILLSTPASLWALKSNELQIHMTADPDATKLVLNSSVCGQVPTTKPVANSPVYASQALAYVQLNGPGQALAFAQVTATGQTLAFAKVLGFGEAIAFAQSSLIQGQHTYIVQPGDDLYQIALRNNTSVATLAALNGLSNSNYIYAGQVIRLP